MMTYFVVGISSLDVMLTRTGCCIRSELSGGSLVVWWRSFFVQWCAFSGSAVLVRTIGTAGNGVGGRDEVFGNVGDFVVVRLMAFGVSGSMLDHDELDERYWL